MRDARNMSIPMWGRSYPDRTNLDAAYRFKPLPITEAAADSNNFVCEFNGGASANETGVGGGLSGADLVLTQHNNVPGVSGGYRALAKNVKQGFSVTAAFMNTFGQSAAGFSALWRLKDIDAVAGGNGLICLQPNTYGTTIFAHMNTSNRRSIAFNASAARSDDATSVSMITSDGVSADPNVSDTRFQLLLSMDFATRTSLVGIIIGDAQPRSLADCAYFGFNPKGLSSFTGATAQTGFTGSGRDCIIGNYDSGLVSEGIKISSVTFAKYPCFIPI